MALFAATEATLVAVLIGSYFYLRFESVSWPPRGVPEPPAVAPLALMVALAASLLPFAGALAAAHAGRRGRALALVALASVVQAACLALQLHLFLADLSRFTPQQSAYASIYYVLLGADHAHVALGLLFDLWLLLRLSTKLTAYRIAALQAIGLYWIVVVGMTVAVTLTAISPRI
jgi:heme/copper-type cytochrome/quinol oxidase subunit 3